MTAEDFLLSSAVSVGDNISVNENGEISLTASNVTSALGYTPLSESNVLSDAEIDACSHKKGVSIMGKIIDTDALVFFKE